MAKIVSMLAILALAMSGQAEARDSAPRSVRSGSLFATVGGSEQQSPGLLSLDMRNGRYQLAPLPPKAGFRAINFIRVRQDRLAAVELAKVRAAFGEAIASGLAEPGCAKLAPPANIAVRNGEAPLLELTALGRKRTAPRELSCWTQAARNLHEILETRFASEVYGEE